MYSVHKNTLTHTHILLPALEPLQQQNQKSFFFPFPLMTSEKSTHTSASHPMQKYPPPQHVLSSSVLLVSSCDKRFALIEGSHVKTYQQSLTGNKLLMTDKKSVLAVSYTMNIFGSNFSFQ